MKAMTAIGLWFTALIVFCVGLEIQKSSFEKII